MSKKLDSGWQVGELHKKLSTEVFEVVTADVVCKRTRVQATFTKLQFADWVNVVALTEKKEIVVIHQYRFGSDRVELEIPGGAIEPDESPVEAGVRELLEETGYQGTGARLIGQVCPNPAIQGNTCYTVLVEHACRVTDQSQDEMEDILVSLMPVEKLWACADRGELRHGLVLNALLFFQRALRIPSP